MSDSIRIEILGVQAPKARPRFARGSAYTPLATREYEERVAWQCRADRVRLGSLPVAVKIELWSQDALRGDVDNYAKAVLDGLVKGQAIDDDDQVVDLRVQRVQGVAEPKTIVRIRALEAS